MEMVHTSYVTNNWCASCYVGGPHGWCSPDGTIASWHNYGKWPSVAEIVADWEMLLKAFPYLDLVCTLHSGETCENEVVPVCSIVVGNGKVEVRQPDMSLHSALPPTDDDNDAAFMASILKSMNGNFDYEHGWPAGWVEEFGAWSTAVMKETVPWLFTVPLCLINPFEPDKQGMLIEQLHDCISRKII
jgi:hypothetical protein